MAARTGPRSPLVRYRRVSSRIGLFKAAGGGRSCFLERHQQVGHCRQNCCLVETRMRERDIARFPAVRTGERVRRSTSASAVPVPFVLSLVVFEIEFFKTVRAYSVTEFRLGVGLNVNFHGLPLATLILNFVARRTGG